MENEYNIDKKEQQIKKREKVIRRIRLTLSTILALTGISIIMSQLVPVTYSYFQAKSISDQEEKTISPVPGSYKREIEGQFAYYDPSQSYWENLIAQAGKSSSDSEGVKFDTDTKVYKPSALDTTYSKRMALTIPSVKIKEI